MASVQKITLSASRDIPFNKLVLSQSNVRRVKAGVSIEELADDIARRTLLQSLSVRPILDAEGQETGMFEVPAGGRRYRALELLVKQKRMNKTQLVPCVVRTGGLAEEDSLAENVHREALHPLDQFRAFQTLREKGLSEEDIAARFFVSATVVKQRLKLAAVSPKLLDIYAGDGMTLEQLMAFTVTNDHARQEQVWEQLSHGCNTEPYYIRRQLTEGAVRATDKRAMFVGVGAYEAAGGIVTRDLFEHDDGGWLQDPALLDRLVIEKLKAEAEKLRTEGWKWISVAPDFPYGHTAALRRLDGHVVDLTDEEIASRAALEAELDRLEQQYAEVEEVPEQVDRRLGEIETALEALNDRPVVYDPAEIAFAGAFVSIDRDGELRIERGYVRREDEPPTEPVQAKDQDGANASGEPSRTSQRGVITVGAGSTPAAEIEAEEDDGLKPLSERLVTELTAHRTLALRDALQTILTPPSRRCCTRCASLPSTGFHLAAVLRFRPRAQTSALRHQDSPTAPRPKRSRCVISNGPVSCPRARTVCGMRWLRSTATARPRCSPIARRSASMPSMSLGTAIHGGSPMRIRRRVP